MLVVDLRSDTVTQPSPGMRRAMAEAEVGDDVLGKDPTAARLERRVAELLGKEDALFFPSGTQANQAAVILHTRPGSEAVCEAESHVFHYEYGDAAWLAGVQLHPVVSNRGVLEVGDVVRAIRPGDRHHPVTTLLCVENTHNMHGGVAIPLGAMRAIRDLADRRSLPVHLDGARLWNAAVASGDSLGDLASCADTVTVCLSKGLGCPIGSLLAGPADLIHAAWSVRKRLGGGMRQVGVLAAAGLWALDHNLERLDEDHARARRLAAGCASIAGVTVEEPDTNIVMIDLPAGHDEAEVAASMEARGVRILAAGPGRLRAVTHLDVDDRGIEHGLQVLGEVLAA